MDKADGKNANTEAPQPPGRKSDNFKRANFVSRLLYCWMLPTFLRGRRRELDLEDLSLPPKTALSEGLGDKLERNWFLEETTAHACGRPPSLARALVKTFLWEHVPDILLIFVLINILKSFQPTVLALLLRYWEEDASVEWRSAMWYAAGLVLMTFLTALVNHHLARRCGQFGMRLRIACCSLIYRKVTRMDASSLNDSAVGKVVNLMSNDVSRFDYSFIFMSYIWIIPLQLILISCLMFLEVGVSGLIGVTVIILQTVPIQIYMSRIMSRLRLKVANATDKRVKLMNEIISGIQVIKMYAWEAPFEKVVSATRKKEIDLITKTSYLRGINLSFMLFTERFTLYCTLLAYTLLGQRITAAVVFPLAQFFSILNMSLAIAMPNAISGLAELIVSIDRLTEFLVQSERSDLAQSSRDQYLSPGAVLNKRAAKKGHVDGVSSDEVSGTDFKKIKDSEGYNNHGFESNEKSSALGTDDSLVLHRVTAHWGGEGLQPTLEDVSLRVRKGQLCAIIGSVGAGKSSLLQLLLGELKLQRGEVRTEGSLSYASQEPWLFVATVRQNILFGLPYDVAKYREVVRVCSLEKDFQQFPRGDQTLVGERGVSLSGGQRARINLARAVYREANVYILDDPLSAVDAAVGRQLFDECICGYLQGRTRLLVTHQLHYLKEADLILILNNGKVENVGTFEELVSSGEDFAKLLAALQEDKEDEAAANIGEKSQLTMSMRRSLSRQGSIASDVAVDNNDDGEELGAEERESGTQSISIYREYWLAGNRWPVIALMVFVMILGQLAATACDYWVTYWTNQEADFTSGQLRVNLRNSSNFTTDHDLPDEAYDIRVKLGPLSPVEYLYVYSGIILSCILLAIGRTLFFFKLSMRSSKGLHNQMFHSLLRGVMSFFDANPSGRILNRFSKDIGAVDELLCKAVMDMLQIFLVGCSIIILVSVSMVWLLIPTAIMGIILYMILMLYLPSAQAIKRIEGVTKSPVFSHLTSTLSGITTIRCTKSQHRFIKTFDEVQDVHTSTWNHYVSSAATLGFWLDSVVCIFLGIVSFAFLLIDESWVDSGSCGLAISQSLILAGMLQYGIRQAAEVISQMTSVERVLQYTHIDAERGLEKGDEKTPADWPSEGGLQMRATNLRYAEDKPAVLNNLNLDIQPGWKVGIVGRTGAGKTSLISALFRLAKVEGHIYIDGVDTGSISLQDLRKKISIIPQEPVLFSASVRYNLDPFQLYEDATLWQALEDVELKESIPSLDFLVTQGGSNFSLGQRQLICLARAILKNNKILVLDEATANVDPQTDAFIQRTIREKFSACTVLTIAHRLNTVVDSDRVLVMNFGRAVEFDHPYVLLNDRQGFFTSMVKETGPKMSKNLFNVARDAFLKSGGSLDESDNIFKEE